MANGPQAVALGGVPPAAPIAATSGAPPELKALFGHILGTADFQNLSAEAQQRVIKTLRGRYGNLSDEAKELVQQRVASDPELRGMAFGTVTEPPSAAEGLLREAAPMAGGAAGAIAGTALTGTPAGGMLGAAIGAGGAELGAQRLAGEEQSLTEAGKEAAFSLAGEGVGRLVLRAGSRVLAQIPRFAEQTTTPSVFQILQEAAPPVREGALGRLGPLRGALPRRLGLKELEALPGQLNETSRALDFLQEYARAAAFGAQGIAEFTEVTGPKILDDALTNIVNAVGPRLNDDQLAAALTAGVEKRLDARNLLIRPLYNTIDEATKPVMRMVPTQRRVDTGLLNAAGKPITRTVTEFEERLVSPVDANLSAVKAFVKPLAAQSRRLRGVGGAQAADDVIIDVDEMADAIPWGDVAELRSRIIATRSALELTGQKRAPAVGRLRHLTKLLDRAAGMALRTQRPDLLPMWRRANALVKRRERELNNALLRSIVKQADPEMVGRGGGKPEAIIGTIFRSETTAQTARTALGERSPEWQALQRGLIQSVWRDATDMTTGVIIGKRFLTNVAKNEKVLREGLGGETYKWVLDFARAAALQQKQPRGSGRIVAVFTQGSAAVGLVGAVVSLPLTEQRGAQLGTAAGAGALLLSPSIVARMLTSPVTGRLLARGLRIAPNTRAAFGLAGQLAAAAFRIQQEMKAEGIDVDQMVRAVPSELSQAVGAIRGGP